MNRQTVTRAAMLAMAVTFGGIALAEDAALPDLNADEYFEGKSGGTFGKQVTKLLGHSNRVAVAGFRVVFVTEAEAHATVRASYLPGGVEKSAAHASIQVSVEGVDNATRQAITDKAYASLLAQLKAAGREVVPQNEIEPLFAKLELTESSADKPYAKTAYNRKGVVFTPTGMPLWWWQNMDAWSNIGPFNQKNMRTVPEFSKEVNAYVISPTFVVDFAQMSSSGNHSALINDEAKVGVSLQIAVTDMVTGLVRADETKGGLTSDGDDAYIRLTKPFQAGMEFALLQDVENRQTKGWMALVTGSSKNKATKVATTDNARYSAAADSALDQAVGALAKFFQQHAS